MPKRVKGTPIELQQRSTLTVVQSSETPRIYVGPPEHHIQWSGGPLQYPALRIVTILTCSKILTIVAPCSCPFHGTKHVFVIMRGMHSWSQDQSSFMLWFYKINDVWKHIMRVKKIVSRFTNGVVIRTTKKIVESPDRLSWWSCGPLLIKVCLKPCSIFKNHVRLATAYFKSS